ncbi:MAG: hypothetical protein ACKVOX_07620 [Rhizobacter sp.]
MTIDAVAVEFGVSHSEQDTAEVNEKAARLPSRLRRQDGLQDHLERIQFFD